ncbi:MAG TPA: hypothetical protein VGR62_13975 [Candidatus Binatia bacterium]|jgi:hypothetical protein|nr:hypothetical protein [Candidatus Binatia bacterium]
MPVVRPLLAVLALFVAVSSADALTVLTAGKAASFKSGKGMVRIAKDPALVTPAPPVCPVVSRLTLGSYPQTTNRVVVHVDAELPCANWQQTGDGFVYDDKAATAGGVRKIVLGDGTLLVKFDGDAFVPPVGPVGYVQLWLTVGDTRYHARFHNFRKNDAGLVVTRNVSKAAADGEAGFWAVLHGDVTGEAKVAREAQTLASLTKAAKRDKKDGRSRFLVGMLHLYRFGQMTVGYDDASPAAVTEITAADAAFTSTGSLLWDRATNRGDSRVPGFVAATTFGLGVVTNDAALRAQGLADLEYAVDVNAFFNIFDYIPVVQATSPGDPLFDTVLADITTYLDDPNTLSCIVSQPEICGNDGLAPHNAAAALVLFGDVFAKAGNLERAQFWYGLASALSGGPVPWKFQSVLDARLADPAGRVALYQDGDPSNDPPIIGAGSEACATCHNR